jgi:RNA polymerase sigma factor for flagellar operon FliA
VSTSEVGPLWRTYKRDAVPADRDRLVLHYSPLVKYVAGRVRSGLPASVDHADLVSDGIIGLIDAIEKFDADRGLLFQTYGIPRIRGAITDGLRAADWVPRSVREKIRDLNTALEALQRRLGRCPEDREVAVELGVSVQALHKIYDQASYTGVASIEDTEFDVAAPNVSPVFPGGDDNTPAGFMDAVGQLPQRDQIVIALYYWENFTLAEIGQVLQVSESRVCQLHGRATLAMRHQLVAASA